MAELPPIAESSGSQNDSYPGLEPERSTGRPASFYLAIFLGLLLLVSAGLNIILFAVSVVGSATSGLGGLDDASYDLVSVGGDLEADTKILRIPVEGAISEGSSGFLGTGGGSVSSVERALRYAAREESVEGILLDINSPGGGVTASDQIWKLLEDFKRDHPQKHIVALFGDLAASGGYYVAMAAEHIVAHPTTTTGSIGVIMSQFDVSKAARDLGIGQTVITSGPNKDMLSPFEEVSEEQRGILQSIVDDLYDRFVQVVLDGRPELDEATVRRLADGRVYSAEQALALGLVDEVGYRDVAIQKLQQLCGQDSMRVVEQRRQQGFTDLLLGARTSSPVDRLVDGALSPSFLYWWPGGR